MSRSTILSSVALFTCISVLSAFAQSNGPAADDRAKAIAAMCEKVLCRKTQHDITLRLPDGTSNTAQTQPFPYIAPDGTLLLYAGETITVGFNKAGDTLGSPVLLKVADASGPVDIGTAPVVDMTLTFQLKQDEGRPSTKLFVTNTIAVRFKYDAQIFVPTANGTKTGRTSTCPVLMPQGAQPNFTSFENWDYPVGMMVITNIRALANDAPQACN